MSVHAAMDICRWLQTLRLKPTRLLVAHAIGHRLGPDGTAWPSLSTLAADTSLARSTVAVALRDLEYDGVITRTRRTRPDGGAASTVYSFGGAVGPVPWRGSDEGGSSQAGQGAGRQSDRG